MSSPDNNTDPFGDDVVGEYNAQQQRRQLLGSRNVIDTQRRPLSSRFQQQQQQQSQSQSRNSATNQSLYPPPQNSSSSPPSQTAETNKNVEKTIRSTSAKSLVAPTTITNKKTTAPVSPRTPTIISLQQQGSSSIERNSRGSSSSASRTATTTRGSVVATATNTIVSPFQTQTTTTTTANTGNANLFSAENKLQQTQETLPYNYGRFNNNTHTNTNSSNETTTNPTTTGSGNFYLKEQQIINNTSLSPSSVIPLRAHSVSSIKEIISINIVDAERKSVSKNENINTNLGDTGNSFFASSVSSLSSSMKDDRKEVVFYSICTTTSTMMMNVPDENSLQEGEDPFSCSTNEQQQQLQQQSAAAANSTSFQKQQQQQPWSILRRFSEFEKFHEQIQQLFEFTEKILGKDAKSLFNSECSLPSKLQLFGQSDAFISERKTQLEQYLQNVHNFGKNLFRGTNARILPNNSNNNDSMMIMTELGRVHLAFLKILVEFLGGPQIVSSAKNVSSSLSSSSSCCEKNNIISSSVVNFHHQQQQQQQPGIGGSNDNTSIFIEPTSSSRQHQDQSPTTTATTTTTTVAVPWKPPFQCFLVPNKSYICVIGFSSPFVEISVQPNTNVSSSLSGKNEQQQGEQSSALRSVLITGKTISSTGSTTSEEWKQFLPSVSRLLAKPMAQSNNELSRSLFEFQFPLQIPEPFDMKNFVVEISNNNNSKKSSSNSNKKNDSNNNNLNGAVTVITWQV